MKNNKEQWYVREEEQIELVHLLRDLMEKYTANESSSVSYVTAQQLMNAILYTIKIGRIAPVPDHNGLVDGGISLDLAYNLGKEAIARMAKDTFGKYQQMMMAFNAYGNYCCEDTIVKGMPEFFRYYDAQFNPQDHRLTLDYPLIKRIEGLSGVQLISAYLDCIAVEQRFLNQFPEVFVISVLSCEGPEWETLIFNLAERILTHVLGNMILGRPLETPVFKGQDLAGIAQWIKTERSLKSKVVSMIGQLTSELMDGESKSITYLSAAGKDLSYRMTHHMQHHTLGSLFC